jgi:putative hydrolase of the HAD superfamily
MSNKRLVSKYIAPMDPIPAGVAPRGALDGVVDCILFDIYGTLFISGSGDIGEAAGRLPDKERLEALFTRYGIDAPPDAVLESFHETVRSTHRILMEKGIDHPEVEIDKIWQVVLKETDNRKIRSFALEYEFLVNPVYPMPHLPELLDGCRKKRIRMGIISNAQFFTPLLFEIFLGSPLESLGFRRDLILYSYEFGYAKPSSFLFRTAAERLRKQGVSSDSILYIGNDMRNDIRPAKGEGFKTALFAGDRRSLRLREDDRQCSGAAPDLIITDLIQLLDHVK